MDRRPARRRRRGCPAACVRALCQIDARSDQPGTDRNMRAFLRHVGGAPRPAQPARAPVTFTLSAGARVDVIVPAGTQVSTAGTPPVSSRPSASSASRRQARVRLREGIRFRIGFRTPRPCSLMPACRWRRLRAANRSTCRVHRPFRVLRRAASRRAHADVRYRRGRERRRGADTSPGASGTAIVRAGRARGRHDGRLTRSVGAVCGAASLSAATRSRPHGPLAARRSADTAVRADDRAHGHDGAGGEAARDSARMPLTANATRST